MQHMDILTAAISEETSLYNTPPEVQKSEVVIVKQEQVFWFLHVALQSLYHLNYPEEKMYFRPMKNVKPFSDWSS